MAGFNLGAFAGGIGQGIEQGQNIREKYRKMADEQVARRAQQAVDTWLQSATSPKSLAPTPGGPAVAPAAPPTPVAIPGAQPLQPAPAPPTMAPPPGPAGPPGANMPAPGGAPQPVPRAAPPPAPPGGPPPPGGAGPQAGPPPPASPQQAEDPIAQSKVALQSVAREIALANPGRKWGKGELLDAVDQALGEMDKLNPISKQIAQLQLEYYKQQIRQSEGAANRESRETIAADKVSQARDALVERIRHDRASEQTQASRAATYQQFTDFSHEDRQAAIQAANDRASQATDSRERVAAQHDADAMARLDKALDDKNWATVAQITAGEYKAETAAATPGQGPKRPAIAPPPKRTSGATAAAAGASAMPPATALKKGVHTTFANGQTWTLGPDGKPQRVK